MTHINMTAEDYEALMEENTFGAPAPRNTILTDVGSFKSSSENTPLSGIDGDGGATTEPYIDDATPSDAPGKPSVKMADGPDNGKITKSSGSSNKQKKPASPEAKKPPFEKEKDKDSNEDEDKDMAKNESLTFEDLSMDEDAYMEHDMASGEIAMTQEFLVKLLKGVAAASLDDSAYATIAECLADCAGEDRTLDVGDIGMVMSKMQERVSGGTDEDVAPGDGELAGPEGGEEHEGETQLYGDAEDDDVEDDDVEDDDKVDECGDEDEYMEGSQEDRQRGRQKRNNFKKDKNRFHTGGNRPSYRKPKPEPKKDDVSESVKSKKSTKNRIDEAWLAAIPVAGAQRKKKTRDDFISDDDFDLDEIKRLAGM